MIVTENTNLNAILETTDEKGINKGVISVSTNLVNNGLNFNLNFNISDKVLADSNTTSLQGQLDDFIVSLRAKMIELGYKITI